MKNVLIISFLQMFMLVLYVVGVGRAEKDLGHRFFFLVKTC